MENKVLEVLVNAGKPLRPGDIAKELGVDSKEVSKAIAELREGRQGHVAQALLLRSGGIILAATSMEKGGPARVRALLFTSPAARGCKTRR